MLLSQLAINSVTTRHQTFEEALSAYSAAGFPNVEFVLPMVKGWMNEGHSLEDVKALLASHRLKCVGGFEGGVECFSSPESQEKNHASVVENVRLIHELGGGTLVVGTDGPPQASVEALDEAAKVFRSVGERIEGMNVSIAIEFNWSPLIRSLMSATIVARKANHPQIGVLFDPAHFYVTPSKFDHLTQEAVSLIKHVHVDDMSDKPGELSNCNSDRVLPGQGVLDLKAIFGRLEEYGYNGYYSIEMFSDALWALPADVAAKQCYDSLVPFTSDAR